MATPLASRKMGGEKDELSSRKKAMDIKSESANEVEKAFQDVLNKLSDVRYVSVRGLVTTLRTAIILSFTKVWTYAVDLYEEKVKLKQENDKLFANIQILATEKEALHGKIRGYETLARLYEEEKDENYKNQERLNELLLENDELRKANLEATISKQDQDLIQLFSTESETRPGDGDKTEIHNPPDNLQDGATFVISQKDKSNTDGEKTTDAHGCDEAQATATGTAVTGDDAAAADNPVTADDVHNDEPVMEHESFNQNRDYILQWQDRCQSGDSLLSTGQMNPDVKELWDRIDELSLDKEVLSIEIDNLTGVLGNLTKSDKPSAFAKEVSRNTIKVSRLEKQNQALKKIVQLVSEENGELKAKYARAMLEKDRQIVDQRQEEHRLLERIKVLEHARDDLTPPGDDPRQQRMSSGEDAACQVTPPNDEDDAEWVKVTDDRQRTAKVNSEQDDNSQPPTAEEYQEMKKKTKKQLKKLKEVLEVNRRWDEQYKQMETQYKMDMAQHQQNHQKNEFKLQQTMNKMIDRAQAKADKAQNEAKEAQQLLQVEKQSSKSQKERLDVITKQIKSMKQREQRLERELYEYKIKPSMAKFQTNVPGPHYTEPSAPIMLEPPFAIPSEVEREMKILKEENQFLKFQADTHKEDFENERIDRERIQGELEELKGRNKRLEKEWKRATTLTRQGEVELSELKADNDRYKKQLKEIQKAATARSRAAGQVDHQSRPPPYNPGTRTVKYSTAPTGGIDRAVRSSKTWNCTICTYENPKQRSTCEMCASPKDIDGNISKALSADAEPCQPLMSRGDQGSDDDM